MNEVVKNEVINLMSYDKYVELGKQINVINKMSKLLDNETFIKKMSDNLGAFFNHPAGVQLSDMGAIILSLKKILPEFENILNLYHDLNIDTMKYLLYGCLYTYIIKDHSDFIEGDKLGEFRISFCNIFDLIKLPKEDFELESKLMSRIWSWLKGVVTCSNDIKIKK